MEILDDCALFATIIRLGGFSHAAKYLGISNGAVSRRIAKLESKLGVILIMRTTRQLVLTKEGEMLWQYAQKINQDLDAALNLIQASATKPKGILKISAPVYFGSHYLMPILIEFMNNFSGIQVNLLLNNQRLDPIEEQLDLTIRGAGYIDKTRLKDSNLKMKLLLSEKIGLYASAKYLERKGCPGNADELINHNVIHFSSVHYDASKDTEWPYLENGQKMNVNIKPVFVTNDMASCLITCKNDVGIGRFVESNCYEAVSEKRLVSILNQFDWGNYHLFAVYPGQKSLPKRTRLLLDFISEKMKSLSR